MAIPVRKLMEIGQGAEAAGTAVRAGRLAEKAKEVPDGMEILRRLPVPPPRDSVPKPRDPRAESVRRLADLEELDTLNDGTLRFYGIDNANKMEVMVEPAHHQIFISNLTEENQGKGLGMEMYLKAAEDALGEGKEFWSDNTVSQKAQAIWEGLERRGYVLERHPNSTVAKNGTMYVKGNEKEPVYKIVGKQRPVEE